MRWRRRWEPVLLLTFALVAPAGVAAWLAGDGPAVGDELPAADVPHAGVLASPREPRAPSPRRWLELAAEQPAAFGRALTWCQRRQGAPLPNCRNVVVADRVCRALGLGGLWGESDG